MSGVLRKKTLSVLFLVGIVLCLAIFLSACDKTDEQKSAEENSRPLYFKGLEYLPDEQTAIAVVSFKGEENEILQCVDAMWNSASYKINAWYNGSTTEITVSPSAIFSAVQEVIPQESLLIDGVEYNRLKVEIRYDTIYKSIKSDGRVMRSGKKYIHSFELDGQSESRTLTLTLQNPDTANWYTMLIACAIAAIIICVLIYLAVKGGLWQKKKNE